MSRWSDALDQSHNTTALSVPAEHADAVAAALSHVLGGTVVYVGITRPDAARTAGVASLWVKLERDGSALTAGAVDAAVQTAGGRALAASRTPIVRFLLQCLGRATTPVAPASPAATDASVDVVAAARKLCTTRLVRSLLAKLADDEDDLYFEGGEHRVELQHALAGQHGGISTEALAAIAAGASNQRDADAALDILRRALSAFEVRQ